MTAVDAWGSSTNTGNHLPKFAWKGNDKKESSGFFHSKQEDNPWLRVKLNRKVGITSVTVRNRLDCCGERLENLEVRAGTKNDNTNEIVGTFKGPGKTGAKHVVQFKKPVYADYLTLQLKKKGAYLAVNGITLNEKPALNKIGKDFFIKVFTF